MRRYSWLKAWQADLLAGVDPRRAQLTEVYDNCRDFGVLRNGDTAENGRGVWVTVTGDQASLSLEDRSTSTGSQVIRTEAVGLDDAPRVFTEMVGTLGAGLVPAVLPAQEVFKRLLRDYVRPALGADGYAACRPDLRHAPERVRGHSEVQEVEVLNTSGGRIALDAGVAYPETVSLFDQANREAKVAGKAPERPPVGQWQSSLGHLAGHHAYWTRLRADDDLETHARWLLQEIRHHLYPAIERELDKAPVPPTPLDERQFAPHRPRAGRGAPALCPSTCSRNGRSGLPVARLTTASGLLFLD